MKIIRFRDPFKLYCIHYPFDTVKCSYGHFCDRCEIADRIRFEKNTKADLLLFSWNDALKQTPKSGGAYWWHFPVILSKEAMDRLSVEGLLNQIVIVDGGPGVFVKNASSEIDVHLFADKRKKYTVSRLDCYGVPNDRAVRRYDELFFMGLEKALKKAYELSNNNQYKWTL